MPANLQLDSLYYGDCLEVMREWPDESFDLVYLDPPFNSKASYNILFGRNGRPGTNGKLAQMVAFEDSWRWDEGAAGRVDAISRAAAHPACHAIRGLRTAIGECGMLAYLSYMAERLAEIRRVLKNAGSVYLHCDPTASHYLKVVMDGVFGTKAFRNEIVWHYYNKYASGKKAFGRNYDQILFYAGEGGVFNPQSEKRDKPARQLVRENVDGVLRNKRGPDGKLLYRTTEERKVDAVWRIPCLQPASKEYLGYPTQKPSRLLERIISASSDEGDAVLDPFCGCGTTVDAAKRLGRRWVGIDVSPFAIDIVRSKRLQDGNIPVNGIPMDMASARAMAREKPFDFEKWAVSRIPGMAPNDRQTGDGGIDGRGYVYEPSNGGGGLVLAQVKGGKISPGQMREFLGAMGDANAMLGIFITLDRVDSPAAKTVAAKAGKMRVGAKDYPRVQLWSIEDCFDGRPPDIPPLADPYTGNPMQADMFAP